MVENGDNDSIRDGDREGGEINGVSVGGGGAENKLEQVHETDNKNKKTSFKREVVKEPGRHSVSATIKEAITP